MPKDLTKFMEEYKAQQALIITKKRIAYEGKKLFLPAWLFLLLG